MSLLNKIKSELVDIIEWSDMESGVLVKKHENIEIKNGAKLTVRPGQVAVLVDNGKMGDVFEPGMHTLNTDNLPILSTLKGWKHGFNSPFKSDLYFISVVDQIDKKWGTPAPIIKQDGKLGAIRIRAFGGYNYKVKKDVKKFLTEVVGAKNLYTGEKLEFHMKRMINTKFASEVCSSETHIVTMSSLYEDISEKVSKKVSEVLDNMGIELIGFWVENISLPPEVEKVLDEKTSMNIIGDDMNKYAKFKVANSMDKENGGGLAGDAAKIGLGIQMAKELTKEE